MWHKGEEEKSTYLSWKSEGIVERKKVNKILYWFQRILFYLKNTLKNSRKLKKFSHENLRYHIRSAIGWCKYG